MPHLQYVGKEVVDSFGVSLDGGPQVAGLRLWLVLHQFLQFADVAVFHVIDAGLVTQVLIVGQQYLITTRNARKLFR